MAVKKPEVRSVSFEPAKGGVISHTSLRVKRGGQGGGGDYDHENEVAVHPTIDHAIAHLKTKMAGCFAPSGKEPGKEEKE